MTVRVLETPDACTVLMPRAARLIEYLKALPSVRDAELCGSLVRGSATLASAIHLAVIVDAQKAEAWTRLVMERRSIKKYRKLSPVWIRDACALEVLGITQGDLWAEASSFELERDIFLLPPNWKDHLAELGLLWRDDPSFAKNFM